MKKKILIFYTEAGAGHKRCAEAIASSLSRHNKAFDIKLVDGLSKTNLGLPYNPSLTWFILSNYLIQPFNLFYKITDNKLAVSFGRLIIKLTWGKAVTEIIKKENPNIVISTHSFLAPSSLAKKLDIPFYVVVTDLGYPHKMWFDKHATSIIVPTHEMKSYAKRILPKNNILNLGYPLKQEFSQTKTTKTLSGSILLLGGGVGSGGLLTKTKILLQHFPKKKIVVVTGNNQVLKQQLSQIKSRNLKVFGFVEDIKSLMERADIIISKAGPATIMEAASLKKPLIITSWIGLQEKDNVSFVLRNKVGLYCPGDSNLPETVDYIYHNYKRLIKNKLEITNGTPKISAFITKAVYT